LTTYRAYGFCVASSFALPELVRIQCACEVIIRRGTAGHVPRAAVNEDGHEVSENDVRLSFEGVGAFRIREGREIVVEPVPGVDEAIVRLSLLGPALAVLLHQRGFLVLHASCVVMDGAVAFLGDSEWGKSTTAAALYRSGRPLVADDVLAVDLRSGSPVVRRAFPQLKLWPESVEALGIEPQELRTIHPDLEKRAFRAQVGFGDDDLPLARLYVLSDGPEVRVEALDEQEVFVELIRHSFAASLLRETATETAHFRQCTSLARAGLVRRLVLGGSIERIPEVIRALEDDRAGVSVERVSVERVGA
jgi:hypothetical protein